MTFGKLSLFAHCFALAYWVVGICRAFWWCLDKLDKHKVAVSDTYSIRLLCFYKFLAVAQFWMHFTFQNIFLSQSPLKIKRTSSYGCTKHHKMSMPLYGKLPTISNTAHANIFWEHFSKFWRHLDAWSPVCDDDATPLASQLCKLTCPSFLHSGVRVQLRTPKLKWNVVHINKSILNYLARIHNSWSMFLGQ